MTIPSKKMRNGLEMPVYGFGTWQMGGRMERDHANDDGADTAAIRTAIELGVTHIDTAEVYADGYTEQLVGRAIQDYDRSQLFIVSKVKASNMAHDTVIVSCTRCVRSIKRHQHKSHSISLFLKILF